MQFLYPSFLWGLLLVSIPIIIHLLRLRRFKVVFFSNNRILRQVQLETRKKSRIKNLLLLLSRVLAIASLVLAFSQPFIPNNNLQNQGEQKYVGIYIDNSFSMEAGEAYHSLLEVAKQKAREIEKAFPQQTRFFLLTNNFDASSFRPMNKNQLDSKINQIKLSSTPRTFPEVLTRFNEIVGSNNVSRAHCFIISDMQETFINQKINIDSLKYSLSLIPLKAANLANISIDSVWIYSPYYQKGVPIQINVAIRNYSNEEIKGLPVELIVNNVQKGISNLELGPRDKQIVNFEFIPYETGQYNCQIKINESPITYDNTFYFSFFVEESINCLVLTSNKGIHKSIKTLFDNDNYFNYQAKNAKELSSGELQKVDLLILDHLEAIPEGIQQEIFQFLEKGGTMAVIPSQNINVESYNNFLLKIEASQFLKPSTANLKISNLDLEDNFFQGVFEGKPQDADFPFLNKYFLLGETPATKTLIRLQNNDAFLNISKYGEGLIYIFSTSFENEITNFHKHSLFVPVFYKIAVSSKKIADIYYTIGQNQPIKITNIPIEKNNYIKIKSFNEKTTIIPQIINNANNINLFVYNQIDSAGHYLVTYKDSIVKTVSFNYTRTESEIKFFTENQIDSLLKSNSIKNHDIVDGASNLKTSILEATQGQKLWKLFLYLVFLFLLLETLILRMFKN